MRELGAEGTCSCERHSTSELHHRSEADNVRPGVAISRSEKKVIDATRQNIFQHERQIACSRNHVVCLRSFIILFGVIILFRFVVVVFGQVQYQRRSHQQPLRSSGRHRVRGTRGSIHSICKLKV